MLISIKKIPIFLTITKKIFTLKNPGYNHYAYHNTCVIAMHRRVLCFAHEYIRTEFQEESGIQSRG